LKENVRNYGEIMMTYLIADIKFYKVDEDGEEIKDKDGNIKLYNPQGRWKDLEYLCEDKDDDDFEGGG